MKKIFGLVLGGFLLLNVSCSFGQSYTESALLFSRLNAAGSARIQGLGGAQVSLGGDYSSAMSNPAGLGMFNKSEITVSPGMSLNSSSSAYLGTNTSASKSALQLPGLSAVLHSKRETDGTGFIGGSLGITITRTNDYTKNFSYKGTNSNSSLIDYFVDDAYGTDVSQFDPQSGFNYNFPTELAYSTNLIYPLTSGGSTYGSKVFPSDNSKLTEDQKENVSISGGQTQANIAYGVNFSDKIFLGGGIGLAFLNYQSTKQFTESNYVYANGSAAPLTSLVLSERLKTTGSGINANLGIIARPVDFLQLGFSYNSPTYYYSVSDTYSAAINTNWNNFDYNGDGSLYLNPVSIQGDQIQNQYVLTTPSRVNLGGTIFIRKSGFISVDGEMVNYSGAKYSSSGSNPIDFSYSNSEIKGTYQRTYNFRIGGEYRYDKFRVRAGYSFMPSPFQPAYAASQAVTGISGGVGYRTPKFYIDIAYVHRQSQNFYSPYGYEGVTTKNTNSTAMVTLGFPFSR